MPNEHFAKYKTAEWFCAEKSCGMHYTHDMVIKTNFDFIFLVTDILTAQILVQDSLPEQSNEIVDVGRAENV